MIMHLHVLIRGGGGSATSGGVAVKESTLVLVDLAGSER